MDKINKAIELIKSSTSDLYHKDFLLTWEKTNDDLVTTIRLAQLIKDLRQSNHSLNLFDSGLAVSVFRDKSTRTRFSFASACNLLGLTVQDMDEEKSQIAHGETVRETANMISFLTEIIGIRDDMFLGEGHRYMKEVGEALDDGFENGVLPTRPGIVNLQCDLDHPTQSMADLLHLVNEFGSLENLKGKKMVMSWTYSPSYGKPLSVPQGIIGLMTRFGLQVELAYPEGYGLVPEIVGIAKENAKKSGGSFKISHSMEDSFKNADIVYPKSWAPFHIMQQRTTSLRNNDQKSLKELEANCLANNARFKDWECDEGKMKLTKNGSALYMHCLPADISGLSCEAGEVAKDVFEKYRIKTYIEAGYKPYIIAAMILANRVADPGIFLEGLIQGRKKRIVKT